LLEGALTTLVPATAGLPPSFAFILHPRDETDAFRARRFSLLREVSVDDADFLARVMSLEPTVVGEVTVGFSPFRGELMCIACWPQEVLTERGRREIERAVDACVERGNLVLGLGALTAPATAGGSRLVDRVPPGVTITNGNAYTAAVLAENVLEAGERTELSRPRVAVVGCTGSVGGAVSRLLAAHGFDLVLVGRTATKAKRALGDLAPVARFSGEPADAGSADVVLLLTSAPSARLPERSLREAAVLIDAAEPPNVREEEVRAWRGRIAYARGGRALIPGHRCTYDFGLDGPEETFACLAETYLLLREGIRDHSVGSPSTDDAERLARVARRHGVSAAPLVFENTGERRQREVVPPR
jgi:fatty aldehyde-generating acyl-ACP reductase